MTIAITVLAERRRILAEVVGEFSLAEVLAVIDGALADPSFEPGFDILSDHSAVSRAITTQQLEGMVAHLTSLSTSLAGARWAIVTTKPASYGMMRMFSVYAKRIPIEVRIFADLTAAEQWLESERSSAT